MSTQRHRRCLPSDLHAAYDWTAAAGELDELRSLSGEALERYCAESADNAAWHGNKDVTALDLQRLHEWLAEP